MAAAKKKADTEQAGLVVLAPLVQAKLGNRVLHFYQGDILPEGVDEESIENLKQLGFIANGDPVGAGDESDEQ